MFPEKRFLKLLVVDDDPNILNITTAFLKLSGFQRVTSALNGTTAREHLLNGTFDLLITDLELPGCGGRELLSLAKGLKPCPWVIVISGSLHDELEEHLLSLGAQACLRKPFTFDALLEEVDGAFLCLASNGLFAKGEKIIRPLISEFEEKDPYVRGQSDAAAQLAMNFALTMDCSLNEIIMIRMASLGSDVGMSMIDPKILTKPGPLTDKEFDDIKRHPLYSTRMIEDMINDFELTDLILKHHENFNGSGYPLSLSGTEVTLDAQIISLANSYSAMNAQRPYRDALRPEEIKSALLSGRGKKWAPETVDVFIDTFLPA